MIIVSTERCVGRMLGHRPGGSRWDGTGGRGPRFADRGVRANALDRPLRRPAERRAGHAPAIDGTVGPTDNGAFHMEELLDKKPSPHPEAAIENVGGRIMAATPDDQLHYFVEDGTEEEPSEVGDRIVELSDGARTVREIAECLCEEFEVDLETALEDTAEFIRQLVDSKVLQLNGGGQPAPDNVP